MDSPFDKRPSVPAGQSGQPLVQPLGSQRVLQELKRLDRDLRKFCQSPSPSGRELQRLEKAVAALALHPAELREIATNRELRCYLGTVMGSEDLSSASRYDLQGLRSVLDDHKQVLHGLFSCPALAATVGAVVVAPTDYREFEQSRDSLALELVSQKLKHVLCPKGFLRWQSSAATSLLWGYEGVVESPSPALYARSTQLRRHAYDFHREDEKERFVSLFGSLVKQGEPIPEVLLEILTGKARREISAALNLDDVISWMRGQLTAISHDVKRVSSRCSDLQVMQESVGEFEHIEAEDRNADERQRQSDFGRSLERLRETSRFFGLYFEGYCEKHESHSADREAAPVRVTVPDEDSVLDFSDGVAALREEVQDKLEASVLEVMQLVCECLSNTAVPLPFPHALSRELNEFFNQTGIELDSAGGASDDCSGVDHECIYRERLIPSFDVALDRRDLASAAAVRLIFPPDDRGRLSIRRFLIDDHIEESARDRVISCISQEALELSHMLRATKTTASGQFPDDVSAQLAAFQEALVHFPLRSIMHALDTRVITSTKELIRALLEWDVGSDPLDEFGTAFSQQSSGNDLPRSFVGLRKAAEFLQLYRDPNLQFHIMRDALSGVDSPARSHLAQAIIDTNLEFAEAWKRLSKGEVSLDQILSECDAAFATQRLYVASKAVHDRLPAPVVSFVSPLFKIGYQILKTQEDFVAPPSSAIRINTDDLLCLQSWQSGLIGNGMSDTRRKLMLTFLDGVRQLQGAIPRSAHSLVFESIGVFATEFLEKAKSGVTEPVFLDGVSFILSGFLISSPEMSPGPRVRMAEALAALFEVPQARILSKNPTDLRQLATDFRSVVTESREGGIQWALRNLMQRASVQALLASFGLSTPSAGK